MGAADDTHAIAYSLFQNLKDNRPKPKREPWPKLAARLTRHARGPAKDCVGLWSPATFVEGGRRCNEDVAFISALVGDLDHVTPEQVCGIIAGLRERGLAFAAAGTYRDTPDVPRLRIVVPFTNPVPAIGWDDVWARANAALFAGLNDPQTADPSRMFYLPAAPEETA